MKPSEIIYWNQLSGLAEYFSKTDMRYKKIVNLFGRDYTTNGILKKLFIDRTLRFNKKNPEMLFEPMAMLSYALMNPKMRKNMEVICDINIVEETEDYFEVSFTEYIDEVEPNIEPLAYIKFQRNLTEPIKGLRGKIAVIIHDVRSPGGTQTTNSALGAMALAFGAYIGGVFDGYWERITNKYKDIYEDTSGETISQLRQKVSLLESELAECKKSYEKLSRIYDVEVSTRNTQKRKSDSIIANQNRKIAELQKIISDIQSTSLQKDKPTVQIKRDYTVEMSQLFRGQKMCVVGGTEKWKTKMKELDIDLAFLDELNFDENLVKTSDALLINTNFTGHSITNKAKQIAQSNNIAVFFTSKNNINNIAKDIVKQFF